MAFTPNKDYKNDLKDKSSNLEMREIYSKIDSKRLVSVVKRKKDITSGRQDLTDVERELQVAACNVKEGIITKPHRHLPQKRLTEKTHESIVVVKGKVESIIYDIDNKTVLEKVELGEGDCLIALDGGHSHTSLEENTLFYEFKNGPYHGVEKDREAI